MLNEHPMFRLIVYGVWNVKIILISNSFILFDCNNCILETSVI